MNTDLDFDADDFAIAKVGVPCPVDWCNAHVLRHALCGDTDGDYAGVHGARVARMKNGRWKWKIHREVARALGDTPSPEMVMAMTTIEDGMNYGLIKGETAAGARQRRARARMGMKGKEVAHSEPSG